MSQEKKNETRNEKGQFTKNNTIGMATRVKVDEKLACKYKPEYCDQLLEYFSQPATRVEYKETFWKGEVSSRTPIIIPNEYPTFEGFAAKLGVTLETLRNWCSKYPQFKYIYTLAKELQYSKLTSNTLIGLYNPLYAKFEAVNNHGKTDMKEVKSDVKQHYDAKTLEMIERVGKRLNEEDK